MDPKRDTLLPHFCQTASFNSGSSSFSPQQPNGAAACYARIPEVHRRMQHLPVLHTQTISNNNFCRQPGHIIRFVTQFCHIVGTLFFSGIVLQRTKFILRRLQSIDVTLRPQYQQPDCQSRRSAVLFAGDFVLSLYQR